MQEAKTDTLSQIGIAVQSSDACYVCRHGGMGSTGTWTL